jgi:hypothetical protein
MAKVARGAFHVSWIGRLWGEYLYDAMAEKNAIVLSCGSLMVLGRLQHIPRLGWHLDVKLRRHGYVYVNNNHTIPFLKKLKSSSSYSYFPTSIDTSHQLATLSNKTNLINNVSPL